MQKNHYQIFSVPNDAPLENIRAIHQVKRQQFAAHPDIVRMLDEALRILSDPDLRKDYDRSLRATTVRQTLTERPQGTPARRGVHFFLAGVAAAGALGWYSASRDHSPPRATTTDTTPRPPPQDTPTIAGSEPSSAATELPIITLTPLAPKPALEAESAPPQRLRPDKRPGFDPSYVAWTVYRIVGAKSRGSGVMLERDKIVTNCHVIAGSYQPRSIVAINSVTHEAFYPEKIAFLSDTEDVCLLHVPGAPDHIASWGSANSQEIGARTYTVSFPGNQGLTWSAGNLLGRSNVSGLNVLVSSNYCRPGVSGGPLFDAEGKVIGITSAVRRYRTRDGEMANECISIETETAKEVLWRTLMSLAMVPIKYESVWSTGR